MEHAKIEHLPLDLYAEATAKSLSKEVKDITHIFHLAFAGDMTNMDKGVHKMLEVLLTAAEQAKWPLQHVYFTTGLKYYGKLRHHSDHAQTAMELTQKAAGWLGGCSLLVHCEHNDGYLIKI